MTGVKPKCHFLLGDLIKPKILRKYRATRAAFAFPKLKWQPLRPQSQLIFPMGVRSIAGLPRNLRNGEIAMRHYLSWYLFFWGVSEWVFPESLANSMFIYGHGNFPYNLALFLHKFSGN